MGLEEDAPWLHMWPVSSKCRLRLLAHSLWWRPSHLYKEAFVVIAFRWILQYGKDIYMISTNSRKHYFLITQFKRVTGELCIWYCKSFSINNDRCHPEIPQKKKKNYEKAPSPHSHLFLLHISSPFQGRFLKIQPLGY